MIFFPMPQMRRVQFALMALFVETAWRELAEVFLLGNTLYLVLSAVGMLLISGAMYLIVVQPDEKG